MRLTAWATLFALSFFAPVAVAQSSDAHAAEERLDFEAALAKYEEAARLEPSSAIGARAAARASALRARSEGGFAALVLLERVRRDPAPTSTAIDDLVRKTEDGTIPPGLVRVEAWVLAADAYALRLERPDDAARLWRRVVEDPASDAVLVRAAASSLASHHVARGEIAAARSVVAIESARLAALGAPPDDTLATRVRRAGSRRLLHRLSVGVLAAASALAALALGRAAKDGRLAVVLVRARGSARLAVAFAAYLGVGGGLLASSYASGSARPFAWLAVALVPLFLVARAWAAAGSGTARARALRASLCAASALGAAFLVLEEVEAAYLDGLGL